MKNNYIIVYIFFFAFPNQIWSQNNNIRFENITTDQGLSQSSVTTIYQDKKGFLWFGTIDGLNRYDGNRFKIFKYIPGDSSSISRSFIWDICEDDEGNIWVGTEGGLNKFNKDTETFTRFVENHNTKNSISNNHIRKIHLDKNGLLWIATENGLNIYNHKKNSFKIYKNEPPNKLSLSNNSIRTIYEDGEGNIWIGTDNGLNLFNSKKETFQRYMHNDANPNSMSMSSCYSICEDKNGFLWIGTQNGGLKKFDKKTNKFKHYKYDPKNSFSINNNFVRALVVDKSGTLWVGTFGGGLGKYDPIYDRFIRYQNDPDNQTSLSGNSIYKIIEDNSGILWLGTAYGGISKYDKWKNQFEFYTIRSQHKNLFSSNATCFYEDVHDKGKFIWIGTWSGLVLFDRERHEFKFYVNNQNDKFSISNNIVRSINKDTHGTLWIGTDDGLNRFNKNEGKFYRYFNNPRDLHSISDNMIKSILVDHTGEIWVGSNSSIIDKYDYVHNRFVHYVNDIPASRNSKFNIIRVLIETQDGDILAGSDEGGVSILDRTKGKFIQYIHSHSEGTVRITNDRVLTLFQNNYGLWIGTGGGGLNCYDPIKKKVTVISEKDGLMSSSVHSILEDKQGNLWLSTRNGISKIDLTQKSIFNFFAQDGLINNEFHVNSFCYSLTGEIFFGGIKGFNSFWPEKIIYNTSIHPIIFTDIQLLNKSIPINKPIDGRIILTKSLTEQKEITLSYKDEVFFIEFLSLDYSNPDKIQYSYFLEGYDKFWNNIGNRHYATYTKIPPGKYTLYVKASNQNSAWNSPGVSLQINITSPFWDTLWFKLFAASVSVGILLLGYKIRTRRIIAANRDLEQRVSKRTAQLEFANKELEAFSYSVSHDLRAPLRAINAYSNIFKEEYENKVDDEGRRLLDVIVSNSVRMGNLISELLEFSRASRTELKKQIFDVEKTVNTVINELVENTNRSKSEIKIHPLAQMYGDQSLMKQVWQNLISNALKFTSKTPHPEIEIGCLTEGEKEIYYIKDNGAGFNQEYAHKLFGVFQRLHNDSEYAGTGAGLAIVQRIIQRHNGQVWATGEINKGATFYFSISQKED